MDEDPAPEQWLSRLLPLPYRVATLLVLGIWLWGSNLQILHSYQIDVPSLIRYPNSSKSEFSTYRLAIVLSIPLTVSLLLFAIFPHEILPITFFLYIILALVIPTAYLSRRGRHRFLHTLRRISIGGLATDQDGRFGDILMADVLTSYAKPIADLYVVGCLLVSRRSTLAHPVNRSCGGSYAVPVIMALPFLIRFRQCCIEGLRTRRAGGTGLQHMANAMKYATAFPAIALSAVKRDYQPDRMWTSETGLSRLWLLAIFTNSFYSFYWDVAKDWDLTLFNSRDARKSPEGNFPYGLRRQRIFKPDLLYYGAIAVDLLLRCTWSLKLSVHLYHFNDLEGGLFVIELFEVLRRWMWVFLRVETEWIRTKGHSLPTMHLGLLDDMELPYVDGQHQ